MNDIMFIKMDSFSNTRVEYRISDESTVDEVLEEFTNFLRACGYVIDYDQMLTFVKDEA